MKLIIALTLLVFFNTSVAHCQEDTAKVHTVFVRFLYGSKPAVGHRSHERKWFGGIHGGHVALHYDSLLVNFNVIGRVHIFRHNKHKHGAYELQSEEKWKKDTATHKYTTIEIPITECQYQVMDSIVQSYLTTCPYDYAFFGMRCASATADILGQMGIVKKRGNLGNVCKNFYPKRLRKRLLRYAKKNNLPVIRQRGRDTRKWEQD